MFRMPVTIRWLCSTHSVLIPSLFWILHKLFDLIFRWKLTWLLGRILCQFGYFNNTVHVIISGKGILDLQFFRHPFYRRTVRFVMSFFENKLMSLSKISKIFVMKKGSAYQRLLEWIMTRDPWRLYPRYFIVWGPVTQLISKHLNIFLVETYSKTPAKRTLNEKWFSNRLNMLRKWKSSIISWILSTWMWLKSEMQRQFLCRKSCKGLTLVMLYLFCK